MNAVKLNRHQISQLAKIADRFDKNELFTVEAVSDNGIGEKIVVSFDVLGRNDAYIDITDVSKW